MLTPSIASPLILIGGGSYMESAKQSHISFLSFWHWWQSYSIRPRLRQHQQFIWYDWNHLVDPTYWSWAQSSAYLHLKLSLMHVHVIAMFHSPAAYFVFLANRNSTLTTVADCWVLRGNEDLEMRIEFYRL